MKLKKLVAFFVLALTSAFAGAEDDCSDWSKTGAAQHLKGRFISPKEVEAEYGFDYTEAELQELCRTIPSGVKDLWWLGKFDYALMPTRPKPMSVSELRGLSSSEDEDRTKFGWLAIKRNPFEGSLGQPWEVQVDLPSKKTERIPNAAEVFYFFLTFNKVRGVKLMYGKCVNTSTEVKAPEREGPKLRRVAVCFLSGEEPIAFSPEEKDKAMVGIASAGKK